MKVKPTRKRFHLVLPMATFDKLAVLRDAMEEPTITQTIRRLIREAYDKQRRP